MAIDKELYQQALAQYRSMNEAELRERIQNRGKRSSQECWQQYQDMWAFWLGLHIPPSAHQRQEKLQALERYYARVQKLEEWRKEHGRNP